MRVPAAYNVLPDCDAPMDAEEKRGWLEDVDAAILAVSKGWHEYSCIALPQYLRATYADAVFAGAEGNPHDAGFHTKLWRELYAQYEQEVFANVRDAQAHALREYRVAALRRFRNIIRRTIPISKREKKPFWG
jgi:hypothetical protein